MKFILVVNLALALFLLWWAFISDVRTLAVASSVADDRRASSPAVQSLEYSDIVDLLERATSGHAVVCAVVGGALIVTSSLGLWLHGRRPLPAPNTGTGDA